MEIPTVEKVALLVLRGALRTFEVAMEIIAAAFERPTRSGSMAEAADLQASGHARTAAGTVEPVDFDEDGQRVGLGTRSPVVGDE